MVGAGYRTHKSPTSKSRESTCWVDTLQAEWIPHLSLFLPVSPSWPIVQVGSLLFIIFEKSLARANKYKLHSCFCSRRGEGGNTYRHLAPAVLLSCPLHQEVNRLREFTNIKSINHVNTWNRNVCYTIHRSIFIPCYTDAVSKDIE